MDTPTETDALYAEAFRIFMQGNWVQLGITDPSELNIRRQFNEAVLQGGDVPARLKWSVNRIWDRHKTRILADWARELEAAESDPDFYTCTTCPTCGCPGMN